MMTLICSEEGIAKYRGKEFQSVGRYFKLANVDYNYEKDIINEIVTEIDKSPRIMGAVFDSPVFGPIPPERLSSGAKGLIMIANDEVKNIYSSVCFGDNCTRLLGKLSFDHDFTILMDHSLFFGRFRDEPCYAMMEDGSIINTLGDAFLFYMYNH